MPVVLERWNDAKMDALDAKVDRLDAKVDGLDAKVDRQRLELREEMKAGFDDVNSRFVGLYRAQFMVGGGIVAALIGVIATQI